MAASACWASAFGLPTGDGYCSPYEYDYGYCGSSYVIGWEIVPWRMVRAALPHRSPLCPLVLVFAARVTGRFSRERRRLRIGALRKS